MLNEKEYRDMREKYEDDFQAGMGAEAIRTLLEKIDLEQLAAELKEELLWGKDSANRIQNFHACVKKFC